ncbi:nuclease A inhibitor family protein [Herpetosiphon giganteus]|uniref:nuclease A inhibitor family protein n=1 Tax=Herpetosiphon giganteus TaxID=2029754 RepID=UPI001958AD53|nr:hypothetical protein [Herpetosiphon giganteus]
MAETSLENITAAADGLQMMSETDAPFTPYTWDAATPFSPEALANGQPIQTISLEQFFKNATTPQDGDGEAEKATVSQFQKLVEVLKAELSDIQVYRVGEINIDAYILGKDSAGNVVGLKTQLVET